MPHLGGGRSEPFYSDEGSGAPVVLVRGDPLAGSGWEPQRRALLDAGYRVIGYDRRGFGRSAGPVGRDYDSLAGDLARLLDGLDLTGGVLVAASTGTGDVIRYLTAHGSARVRKAVLVSTVAPYLLRTGDNPDGVDAAVLDAVPAAPVEDWRLAVGTDFRAELPRLDVPVLLLHGEADSLVPIDATANRLPGLIGDLRLEVVPDGSHDLGRTAATLVNRYLLDFVES
jgi:non-heme chloroperoxidase